MQRQTDGTIVLARSQGLGAVTMCSCGVVRLQVGPVTVQLEGTALVGVERMIQDALDSLCEIAAEHGIATPPSAVVQ